METCGFANRPLHTSLVLQIHACVARQLNLTLLNLTQVMTRGQRDSYNNGTLQLKTRKMLSFVPFKCANQLKGLAGVCQTVICSVCAIFPTPATNRHQYCCPQGHCKDAGYPFDLMHTSETIWCSACAALSGSVPVTEFGITVLSTCLLCATPNQENLLSAGCHVHLVSKRLMRNCESSNL